ncbi:MAG: stage III sporulation protein AE [Lachnospiraceae bacterium]|nr:stage III sporulation protein AE [Lachnospiraceae bacterium]
MIRIVIVVLFCLVSFFDTSAADTIDDINSEMDYSELDNWLDNNTAFDKTFTEYVEGLLTGSEDFSVKGITKSIVSSCVQGMEQELSVFSTMFLIMGMAAIFTTFTSAIKNSQVSEMGFYLTYMLTVSVLSGIFINISSMAEELLIMVTEFMNLLTPAYMMGMAFCTGSGSATAMYEISLLVITLADSIILNFVFPLIDIYLMMAIANHVTRKGMFVKMAELIYASVKWINKTLIAVVVGLSAVQSLVAPGVDQLKRSVLTKASGMIPVIGNLVGGMTETVLGAGMVLKNVIGVAGVLAIVILCAVPISKIGVMQLAVRFSGAVVEPIVDNRLTEVITDTGKAISLLLETVAFSAFLFILVIVILAVGTGI